MFQASSFFLLDWFIACLDLVARASPYLLLGLVGAGLMQALLPPDMVSRLLGGGAGRGKRSVVIASLIGAPLPL